MGRVGSSAVYQPKSSKRDEWGVTGFSSSNFPKSLLFSSFFLGPVPKSIDEAFDSLLLGQ